MRDGRRDNRAGGGQKQESDGVALYRIQEQQKTIRHGITWVCCTVLGAAIVWAVHGILTKDASLWSVLTILAGSAAAYYAGTAKFIVWIIVKFRTYIATHHQRTVELESERDPGRTSSGLLEDGRSPHDD